MRHKKEVGRGEIVFEKKQRQEGGEGNGKTVEGCTFGTVVTRNYLDDQMKEHKHFKANWLRDAPPV